MNNMQGYNENFISLSSPLLRGTYVPGMEFDTSYEVQARKINASKVNLGEIVKRVAGGTVLGTFNTSQALNLTSAINFDVPQAKYKTFGKPIVGIYQGAGTTSGSQIFPIRGTAVTLGRYQFQGGVDDYSNYNGTADQFRLMIIDTNGTSTQTITFAADWLYLDYVSGVAV